MEEISRLLHGSYAYLLIFQILLVATLSLLALSLLVRRIKFSLVSGSLPEKNAREVTAMEETLNALRLEREALSSKVIALESSQTEAQTAGPLAEQNRNLNEKVKYLESRLLEYEILQEEIGSISILKVENEKLRKQIVELEKTGAKSVPLNPVIQESQGTSPSPALPSTQEGPSSGTSARQAEIDNLLSELGEIAKG